MNLRFRCLIEGASALCVCAATLVAQTGSIMGTVETIDGKPVANAVVVIGITAPPTVKVQPFPIIHPFTTIVNTDSNGQFAASGIPAGSFQVCPQLPLSDLLSPCSYQSAPPTTTVSAGQTVNMPALILKQGVHVSIRINDQSGLIASSLGKVTGVSLVNGVNVANGASVYVGAYGAGIGAMPAIQIRKDSTGYDEDLLIPYDQPVQIGIASSGFALSDSSNAVVDKNYGKTYPITVPSGQTAPTFTFTVKGLNP